MATERIKLDTRGKNILQLFQESLNEIGAINKLTAGAGDANTYDGPDSEVNITWPKAGGYNRIGAGVGKYQEYFIREITSPSHALTPIENDTAVSNVNNQGVRDQWSGKSPRTLEYTDNPYSNSNGAGGSHQGGNFFRFKSRKSLNTLFQETINAFFYKPGAPVYRNSQPAPGEPSNETNRYDAGEGNAYDYKFMFNQGRSFVDPPNSVDIGNQALQGFALGQLLGGNITFAQRVRTESQKIGREFLQASADAAEEGSLEKSYFEHLVGMLSDTGSISQLYVPGWGRPAENWLTKKPLHETLNQNILLPPKMPNNKTGNGEGAAPGMGNYGNTFMTLYTRNRAGSEGNVTGSGQPKGISNEVFINGIIAGTALNLIQEPISNMDKEVIKNEKDVQGTDSVPFSFKKDDAQYLTYEKRDAGWRSNTETANGQPDKLNQAVRDYSRNPGPNGQAQDTVGMSQHQQFPFVFSTVNKTTHGRARHQLCYLQAIINSLSEAYAPVWATRHFFGRSEQAHTYTFTDRTIDLGFTIFANTMRQLQNVYERVLWLAQQCYPDYDQTGRMSAGPIVAMRIGDLFQYRVGIIRNLSYDWMFGGGKWESTAGVRMPQGCTVTMSYQIIHERQPDRDYDFYGGPVGGLNAATTRFRSIVGSGETGAFGPWEQTNTESAGYDLRQRFIPGGNANQKLEERSHEDGRALGFLDKVAENTSITDQNLMRTIMNVPIGVDEDNKTVYADAMPEEVN